MIASYILEGGKIKKRIKSASQLLSSQSLHGMIYKIISTLYAVLRCQCRQKNDCTECHSEFHKAFCETDSENSLNEYIKIRQLKKNSDIRILAAPFLSR